MFKTTFTRSAVLLATAGALIGVGTCTAFAATPTGPTNPTGSSKGVNLTNDTAYQFTLTSVSGDNEGVPGVGSTMGSGDHQNFEVTYRFTKKTSVTADYNIYDVSDGYRYAGTAQVTMTDSGSNSISDSATFSYTGTDLGLTLDTGHAQTPKLVGPAEVQHLTTDSPEAQDLIKDLCQTGNDASCSFTPTSEQHLYDWQQIAAGYNANDPGASVTADKDVTTGVTDSWGVAVSADAELAGVVKVGVSASYDHDVSLSTTYSTSYTAPVDEGYTGFIFGAVPVIRDSGTLAITLGNTTWDVDGVHFDSPNTTASKVDYYEAFEEQGELRVPTTTPVFPQPGQ